MPSYNYEWGYDDDRNHETGFYLSPPHPRIEGSGGTYPDADSAIAAALADAVSTFGEYRKLQFDFWGSYGPNGDGSFGATRTMLVHVCTTSDGQGNCVSAGWGQSGEIQIRATVAEPGGAGDTLPGITMPSDLPMWLRAGHSLEPQGLYVDTPMSTGHARKRRIYRSAPRVVTVALFLTPAQARSFWNWFEGPLMRSGEAAFSTRLPDQGPRGLLWWNARFVEPPTYEAQPRGSWRLTAKLLIRGEGRAEGPPVPDLASSVRMEWRGAARLRVGKPLASESSMAWLPSVVLSSAASMSWLSAAPPPPRIWLASAASMAWLPADPVDVPVLMPEVLFIDFEGPHDSTEISDAHGHTVVNSNGRVKIDTAIKADGTSSGRFSDIGGYVLYVGYSSDFELGASDFSISLKLRLNTLTGERMLLAFKDYYYDGWMLHLLDGVVHFKAYANGSQTYGGPVAFQVSGGMISADTWHAIEVSRAGSDLTLTIDGAVVASATASGAVGAVAGADAFYIGADGNRSVSSLVGHLDSIRIRRGPPV